MALRGVVLVISLINCSSADFYAGMPLIATLNPSDTRRRAMPLQMSSAAPAIIATPLKDGSDVWRVFFTSQKVC
ncbi:hypothetical protein BDN71DRAFT_1440871 [Pleurotus eryngii]|uniref:Secreted protein n=1 Tax=Pleurotus eryngii TaxID=5323 RepID=A0A9P6A6Z7_PLEER|nr:hypothetical protein BDN71DRAFT_1440871 [Pleurotus eryngii]